MPVIVTLYLRISIEADVPGPTTSLRQRHVQLVQRSPWPCRSDARCPCAKSPRWRSFLQRILEPWGWFMNLWLYHALPSGNDCYIAIEDYWSHGPNRNSWFTHWHGGSFQFVMWKITRLYRALPHQPKHSDLLRLFRGEHQFEPQLSSET